MSEKEKKIEIDGPVEIVIGSKEEEKKVSVMPTKCKDDEDIYFNGKRSELEKFFLDEFNKSTQKGFLNSIKEIEKIKSLKEIVITCKEKINADKECGNVIPNPIHCDKFMNIIKKENGKIEVRCQKCNKSLSEEKFYCAKCKKSVSVKNLEVELKKLKMERIKVILGGSKEVFLCPEGTISEDLKFALYKTSKGNPSDFFAPETGVVEKHTGNNDITVKNEFTPTKDIFVKFRQFNPKTGKKEVRTSIRWKRFKPIVYNRSWEISPLGLPKGTVRSILLLMVFWMFLGFFLPEPDKIFHPLQVEVFILLIIVFIPSLLDKLDIKDDYKTGGKLTFLGGAGIFGWFTFQEFFEASTFNLMVAPLFVLMGIALRKAVSEVVENHPESATKTYLTLLSNHLLALGVIVVVGIYVYFNLTLGAENVEDIFHYIFAIYTSFYVSERLFEQDIKIKTTYYPEKALTSTV